MAMDTGFQHQQPLGWSAAVRSAPSPRHAGRMALDDDPASSPPKAGGRDEEKRVTPPLKR